MDTVNLKYGFIKLNTSYIPTIWSKELVTDRFKLNGSIYIKSKIPLELEIGGLKYTINNGEHYIPSSIHTYHEIKILTDIFNNSECEIYHNCACNDEYFTAEKIIINYLILINSIFPKNKNECTIFSIGMGGSSTYKKICDRKLDENYINFSRDFYWLFYYDIYMHKDPNQYTYSQCIYHMDIDKVQKDEDVTQYLINWDKNFVRQSYPPCIAISYYETNYEPLKKILKNKYDIKLNKPQPNDIRKIKPYEEFVSQILERNNKIKQFEELGIFEFVTLNEIPFTMDLYNTIKKQYNHSDVPFEDLNKYDYNNKFSLYN